MLSYFSTAHNQQLYAHAPKNGFTISSCHHIHHWLVVWNMIFIFPCIGNHPPDWLSYFSEGQVHHQPVAIMLYLHYDTFDTVKNDVYIIYIYMYVYTCIDHIRHLFIISSPCLKRRQEIKPPLAPSTDGVLLDSPESLGPKNEVLRGSQRYTHQYPENPLCVYDMRTDVW